MTQDGFAAAERIAATLDALAEALLGERATHYPVAALSEFRRGADPATEALFRLRLSPSGPGILTVHGLGMVVEAGTAHRLPPSGGAAAAAELTARYGGGSTVRGVTVGSDAPSAAEFQLPVSPEAADEMLRPVFAPALAALATDRDVLEPEELATGSGAEVRLLVPSVFHPLTVRGGTAPLTAHLAEVAEELFAGGDTAARRDWAVISAALTEEIAAAGVIFAGISALRVDGRPTHASLVVSLSPSDQQLGDLAAELAEQRPHAEVWTVLLPAGPAALLVEPRTAPVPASLTADGQRRWVVSSVAEVFLPLPDQATVLTLQLSTVQADDWELYAGVFAKVLESIELAWDGVWAGQAEPAADLLLQPEADVPAQPVDTAPVPPMPPAPPAAPPAPAAAPAGEDAPALKGTAVRVPPADFNPFAPPAPTAAQAAPSAAAAPATDFVDPFGASPTPAAAPAAAQAPAAAEAAATPGKGTPVRVPPPDFNPFAPPAPTAAAAPAAASTPGKGTPVNVPPADFNPFAASSAPAAPAAAPVVSAAPAAPAQPKNADPFGTVVANEPQDPFGTVTKVSAPAARTAPTAPPAAPPMPTEPPAPGKGTPVRVPPADFNPFAPPAPAAAPAPVAEEAPATPGKGTPVKVPPADFNPFAAPAPPPPPPAAPAAQEPPADSPFG